MTDGTEPYAHEYLLGRQTGRSGARRDTNPYFTRQDDAAGVPESHEVWRSRYDVWRQGWMEGHVLFEADHDRTTVAAGKGLVALREHLADGTEVVVRPLHDDDVALERRFIEDLSPTSRRFRFLDTMTTPSDALLELLMSIDPQKDAAFVAVIDDDGQEREIGVARFAASASGHDCEFAVAVADAWQRKGLGALLMTRLVALARSRGIATMDCIAAADNRPMRKLAERLHFTRRRDPVDTTLVIYSTDLAEPAA